MHKRLRRLILAAAFFMSACATTLNAPTATEPVATNTEAVAAITATTAATPGPTAAATTPPPSPTPAPTDTPLPAATTQPAPSWHWAIQPDTGQIVAVNQLGEVRTVGEPRPDLLSTALTYRLDAGRALVLADDGGAVRPFLLTPESLAPIQLPANVPYDTVMHAGLLQVVGAHRDFAAFWYMTFAGEDGHSGTIEPPHGPLLVVDLTTLTGELVDPDVNVMAFDDPRAWVHQSADGRYLRYLAGSRAASRIREIDLETGSVRTVHEQTGKVDPYVRASRDGSAWVIENNRAFLDLATASLTPLDTETIWYVPLGPDRLLATRRDCIEPCALQVTDASGQPLVGTYQPPWGQIGSLTLLLPGRLDDGAVIVATTTLGESAADPAVVAQYPDLDTMDRVVFRLNPDGSSDVVGVLPLGSVSSGNALPISADGSVIVLFAPDRSALRLVDLAARRTLAEVPLIADLADPTYTARFFDHGIYVSLDAETAEGTQLGLRLTYLYATGVVSRLDEPEPAYTMCNDLLPDGSILCWHYPDWNEISSQLVRYSPDWTAATLLLEDHLFFEVVP